MEVSGSSDIPKAVSPADGPVAVTGASGYIGSWTVRDLLEKGYRVRACVRDMGKADKVDHLLAMNSTGEVELFEADLFKPGSYDTAFSDCCAVMHVGATVGYNQETPQQVYDGCFTEVEHVVESVKKAGTVKRFIFTSSFAAVGHPRPQGYVFTEKDWCGDNIDGYRGNWKEENIAKNRDIAYAMAKANSEKMIYRMAEEDGRFDAMAILPIHVIGPLMCINHDQGWSWQNCIKQMMQGKPYKKSKGGRMLWNNVDVRDVAKAHRLCAESAIAKNGSRYILSASDRSGELFTWQLQAKLKELFPDIAEIGGEYMEGDQPGEPTYDSPRSYCLLAKQELGLETYPIDETIKANGDSLFQLDLLPGDPSAV
ncbi:MAG: NAD-dependent epimerase/dehydratase family protein [Pseudomonadales bacterium]|jgi:dihydroflavonol-4-reductase|nr:NAD-dependent epimerase/dehydratase family protein [Pseudomonadales bacterium]|tara:strand:- start:2581 stop:3687 length:1107 start_codon:yes stop_codon:yes gene_type:complete